MILRPSAALLILWTFAHTASAATVTRYEVGPWPVVSQLIGYGDRLWFVNSVKGVNHNSADLYSVPHAGGAPRYERHLFSQDAGDPVVHRGLLYWPHEDGRTEPGIGVFEVTDGTRWEFGEIPTERAFHVHAMAEADGALYAAPSAWKGSVARSRDGGASWDGIYLHPTPERKVSRITTLATLGNQVFGTLRAPEGRRLIRVDDGSGRPVPGWPKETGHAGFAAQGGWLYGLVTRGDAAALWLIGDGPVREVPNAKPEWPALAASSRQNVDWHAAAAALDTLLADPSAYATYGTALRQRIAGLPRTGVPEDFYPNRLAAAMPAEPLRMFGNIVLPSMADMGRWRVYWGMGLARSGRVRPEDILRAADYTPNGPMKFFSTAEIAMWAAGRLGHADRAFLIYAAIEGAITFAKGQRSTEPLERLRRRLPDLLPARAVRRTKSAKPRSRSRSARR